VAWLARYVDSPATLASYRKEAERLMLRCALQRGVALSLLPQRDLSELHMTARNKLKSARKRPSIIAACWMQATLW
jgi:hypothetical protein